MARQGRRVAVIGATGNIGAEVIRVLEERDFPVGELLPVATDRSLGEVVELRGREYAVVVGDVPLAGMDVVLLCVPRDAAPEWARRALEARAPCIDLSGCFAAREEVPLVAAELLPPRDLLMQPLVGAPAGPPLAWALALAPLVGQVGVTRLWATSLESVSGAGREGVRALESEVVALFSQSEAPESSVFAGPVAFDLVPELGAAAEAHGASAADGELVAALRRVLASDLEVAVTRVRVPTFSGMAASLRVETPRPVEPERLGEWLCKAPGVELWDPGLVGPTTRDATGRDTVLVGRIRRDPTAESGLLLWLAADPVRIAAHNAVRIAEARFDLH